MEYDNSKISLIDKIAHYIDTQDTPVTSVDLAQKFMFFKNVDSIVADIAIKNILLKDARFSLNEKGYWNVLESKSNLGNKYIDDIEWISINIVTDENSFGKRPIYFSVWSVKKNDVSLIESCWLINPKTVSKENTLLINSYENTEEWSSRNVYKSIESVNTRIREHPIFFLSFRQYSLWLYICNKALVTPCDDVILASQMLRILNKNFPKTLTLNSCYNILFNEDLIVSNLVEYGFNFANCIVEFLNQIKQMGVVTRDEFEKLEHKNTLIKNWAKKTFTEDELRSFPKTPGVYGFKDENGKYIYVGKASNLSRRLLTYFRITEESPKKLERIRKNAVDLTVHSYGSELESLLVEHRLILKHNPILNKAIDVKERKGQFNSYNDSIILLKDVSNESIVSVWIKREQKILLKKIRNDFDDNIMLEKLRSFFFSGKLSPSKNDFSELEITLRWMNQNRDRIIIIPVYQMKDELEIIKNVRSYWNDVTGQNK